jgi:hypothetical protein
LKELQALPIRLLGWKYTATGKELKEIALLLATSQDTGGWGARRAVEDSNWERIESILVRHRPQWSTVTATGKELKEIPFPVFFLEGGWNGFEHDVNSNWERIERSRLRLHARRVQGLYSNWERIESLDKVARAEGISRSETATGKELKGINASSSSSSVKLHIQQLGKN